MNASIHKGRVSFLSSSDVAYNSFITIIYVGMSHWICCGCQTGAITLHIACNVPGYCPSYVLRPAVHFYHAYCSNAHHTEEPVLYLEIKYITQYGSDEVEVVGVYPLCSELSIKTLMD